MPIEVRIEDGDLTGFSDPAKEGVRRAGEEFMKHIIAEANRLESAQNTGGPTEITQGLVMNAASIQRPAVGKRAASLGEKIWRIAASVLSLSAGVMYDSTSLQSPGYMVFFILVVAAAIIATTVVTMKE